jgi:hypothetical protein
MENLILKDLVARDAKRAWSPSPTCSSHSCRPLPCRLANIQSRLLVSPAALVSPVHYQTRQVQPLWSASAPSSIGPLGFPQQACTNSSPISKESALKPSKGAHLDRYVTDEQRSSRPVFNATLRAAASWLFFRVARSTRMTQIWALRSRKKQPTDLRRKSRDLGGTIS